MEPFPSKQRVGRRWIYRDIASQRLITSQEAAKRHFVPRAEVTTIPVLAVYFASAQGISAIILAGLQQTGTTIDFPYLTLSQ